MNDDKYGANDRGLNKYNIRRKDELVKENERLRELLRECQPYLGGFTRVAEFMARELRDKIEKELGDE
jgi:hypothetical protein